MKVSYVNTLIYTNLSVKKFQLLLNPIRNKLSSKVRRHNPVLVLMSVRVLVITSLMFFLVEYGFFLVEYGSLESGKVSNSILVVGNSNLRSLNRGTPQTY